MNKKRPNKQLYSAKLLFDPEEGANKLTFPTMCKTVRKTFKLTQSAMAKKLGVRISAYQAWEYAESKPASQSAGNLSFLYLQTLYINNQTSEAKEIKLLLDSLLTPQDLQQPNSSETQFSPKLLFDPNKENQLTFVTICKVLRDTFNVAQSAMAERLGVSSSCYQYWEYGKAEPSSEAAANLCFLYLQCLYIQQQTSRATEIKLLLDSLLGNNQASQAA